MSNVYLGAEIAATFSEAFIILFTIYRLFLPRYSYTLQRILTITSFIAIGSLTVLCNSVESKYKNILDIGIIFIYILITLILYKGNVFLKIIVPIVLMITILIINVTVNIFMSYFYNKTPEYVLAPGSNIRLLGLFVTKFAFLLTSQFLCQKVKKRNYDLKSDEWIGITIIFLISAGILFATSEIQYKRTNNDLNILIQILGIAVINVCVFWVIFNMAKKNRQLTLLQITNMQSDEKMRAIRSIEEIYNDIRIIKHDMKNEWIVIYNALQTGDDLRTKELLEKMIDKVDNMYEETIPLSDPSINSIVNYKLSYAKQSGIYCTSMIQDDFSCFEEYDIVMLIANLLDNAIEACKEVISPRIDITITTKMNYLSIVIGNSINKSVLKENGSLATSKTDKEKHGFGIQSIKQIAEKYSGMVDFYEQNNMFFADVMLKKETTALDKNLPNSY